MCFSAFLIAQNRKKVYENNREIHEEKNSKILLDGYVNYKGLKAINLANNNFGTLAHKTKFDCFEKNETIDGQGIIETANCGYTIDNIGTLDISCKDIKLKDLNIKFEHEE